MFFGGKFNITLRRSCVPGLTAVTINIALLRSFLLDYLPDYKHDASEGP